MILDILIIIIFIFRPLLTCQAIDPTFKVARFQQAHPASDRTMLTQKKIIRGLISHWCKRTNQDAACRPRSRPQVRTRTSSRCLSTRCSCPATHGTRVDVRSSTSQQCRQPCDEKQRLLAKLIFWIVVCINHICAQTAQHRKASLSSEE